jgi:hypothetical protein
MSFKKVHSNLGYSTTPHFWYIIYFYHNPMFLYTWHRWNPILKNKSKFLKLDGDTIQISKKIRL